MTIGESFRTAREEKGLTLSEIQDKLKIRTRYLEALENDNFDLIPGEAYVKAFIKGYANFLGLDHNELVKQYEILKEEEEQRQIEEETDSEDEAKRYKTLISFLIIAVILTVLFFIIYNGYLLNNTKNDLNLPDTKNSQEVAAIINNSKIEMGEEIGKKEIGREEIDKVVNNSKETKPKDIKNNLKDDSKTTHLAKEKTEKNHIEILVKEKSWLQIFVDGNNVYEGVLDKGNNKSFSYRDNVSLKIGNAAGIQVRKDNKVFGPWGEQGEVIKKTID